MSRDNVERDYQPDMPATVAATHPYGANVRYGAAAPPKPGSVLLEAEGLVHGARQADYGHPSADFGRTAKLASVVLAGKLREPLTAEDVALFMVCLKLSREVNRHKRDNVVDLCGYVEALAMLREGR